MNSANFKQCVIHITKSQVFLAIFINILLLVFFFGCNKHQVLPSAAQLVEFENAGPVTVSVSVDLDRLIRAKTSFGSYHIVPGDVLELTMPALLLTELQIFI